MPDFPATAGKSGKTIQNMNMALHTLLFSYRHRTLNRFRGQGAPNGRLGFIGRNIFFIIFPVTFKGDSSFANRL